MAGSRFTCYPLLPAELRLKILSLLLPRIDSRLMELQLDYECIVGVIPEDSYAVNNSLNSIAAINHESWEFVTKSWICILGWWIHVDKDVLYLLDPGSLLVPLDDEEGPDRPKFLDLSTAFSRWTTVNRQKVRKVKRLALTYFSWRKNRMFRSLQAISQFERLEEVYVVFNAGTMTGMESNSNLNEGDWLDHVRTGEAERMRYISMVEKEVVADLRELNWGDRKIPQIYVKDDKKDLQRELTKKECRSLLESLLGVRSIRTEIAHGTSSG